MPKAKPDAEDALEQATIALFASLGWRTVNAYDETYGPAGTLGRTTRAEVLLAREQELDAQIYKTFANVGAVTEDEERVHAVLSARADIIVITDEAHRSQYDIFAQNMRSALPHAAFIGFTGTPLLVGEEKTRAVFGDYLSIYNFRQKICADRL